MSELNEIERGQLCQSTIESLYEATGGLKQFPGLLKKIIANKAWEKRVSKGRTIELANLRELITEKPIRGWGEDPKKVEAVIKDDPEALVMFREAMKAQGGDRKSEEFKSNGNNVTDRSGEVQKGNSKAYTLSRLERESPELFEAVCEGEMSANAAAIKAGFRKPPPTHEEKVVASFAKCENRISVLRELIDSLDPHEVETLRGLLP